MSVEAYPLAWPPGRKRTPSWSRETAKFDVGFARARALPPPAGPVATDEHWSRVLNVPSHASTEDVKQAYRRAASSAHPDKGGSNELMARVNAAWARFAAERGL